MNEPNTQEQHPDKPRLSNRATNFLLSNSNSGSAGHISQTRPIDESSQNEGYDSPQGESNQVSQSGAPEQPSGAPRKTGVISSTIYPAQRPGNESNGSSAAKTQYLDEQLALERESAQIVEAERARQKDAKMDNLADKITNVLEKLSYLKTGILNSEMKTSQKMQFMAEKFPGVSSLLSFILTRFEPLIVFVQKFNQKMVEKNLIQAKAPPQYQHDDLGDMENAPPPPPEKVSFLELAEKNIIFCDNRKRPLYTQEQMRGKHGYTASEDVLQPMIFEEIMRAFQEVAPKAKAIPTPTGGMFAGTPMDQVMENIEEDHILMFLNYVIKFPRGYVGKNFRITESFAGWVVSGTPDD